MYNNVNVNHPLIQRENNYVSIKKQVSIHSDDRDKSKWINSNEFEIELPQLMKQVQYMKLSDITIPSELCNISSVYQNNKMLLCKNNGGSDTYIKNTLTIYSTNGCGNGAIVASITITNGIVASIDVDGGVGYEAGDKIIISINDIELGSYIILSGDLTNGVFNAANLTGAMPTNHNKITNGVYNITDNMTPVIITVPDGLYTPENLATTLETLINTQLVTNYSNNASILGNMYVVYNKSEKKFYIGSTDSNEYGFFFDERAHNYILATNGGYGSCPQNNDQYYTKKMWGLGALLGFEKNNYISISIVKDGMFNTPINNYQNQVGRILISGTGNVDYTDSNVMKHSKIWLPLGSTNTGRTITAPNMANMFTSNTIYMEVDKYNNSDDLVPYVINTSSYNITNKLTGAILSKDTCNPSGTIKTPSYKRGLDSSSRTSNMKMRNAFNNPADNGNYGGKVNSYFAKLVIPNNNNIINNYYTSLIGDDISSITLFSNQLEERIQKIKVKFRFHDGTLVDFGNSDVNFTIEFGTILSDQEKNMNIRNIH